ncbi:MAG: UvrD-helicase domain-containing protein [Sandaracinaceae bacterium]|nr:UvrD-helicase domain-containing protein [Sandaracinaceae bacterium]
MQREAVLHPGGPLLVFAGAGSGKTRVIVHRIAHLMSDHKVPAFRIFAATFTNKAAKEMRSRIEAMVQGGASELCMGTFHSLCALLLRRHAKEFGVKRDFLIYDENDQIEVIKSILDEFDLSPKEIDPRKIASRINRAKDQLKNPEDLIGYENEVFLEIFRKYQQSLAKAYAFDFGDLIMQTTIALENDSNLRETIASRFIHVLVDEFQDTNHAQFRLIRALSSAHRNVFVVGDDDQSIYGWRGADRRNIEEFRKCFPEARVIVLDQNYRSTKRILRVANAVIQKNKHRAPKVLWTENEDGDPVSVVRCASDRSEADFVVKRIKEMQRSGIPLTSIAILYRTHAQSRPFEDSLIAHGIPYRIIGGFRFYERTEIKDAIAYLRILFRPEDDVSFLRIVNRPARGIGEQTIQAIRQVAEEKSISLWDASKELIANSLIKRRSGLYQFIEWFDQVRNEAKSKLEKDGTIRIAQLAKRILEESGYLDWIEDDESRIENINAFLGMMEEFQDAYSAESPVESQGGEWGVLRTFLEQLSLEGESPKEEGEALALMSIHASKGLEFPHVFLVGLEEGVLPLRASNEEELEEERRLAYVAFTRARKTLTITLALERYLFGFRRHQQPSRFLWELPASEIKLDFGEEKGWLL